MALSHVIFVDRTKRLILRLCNNMTLENQLKNLIRINQMVARKGTGSTIDLAKKMNISIRTCQRLLSTLKSMGCPLEYSKGRSSFVYYKENGRFVIAEWVEDTAESKLNPNGKLHYSKQ